MSNKWFKKTVESEEEESEEELSGSESEEERPTNKGWFKNKIASDSEDESEEESEAEEDEETDEEEETDDEKADESDDEAPQKTDEQKRLEERRSKWLKKEGSDSDSDSDLDSDLDDDEKATTSKRSKWLESDSDDEGEKRVVRSGKEKRIAELNDLLFKLSTKISANAWKDIEDELTKLQKAYEAVQRLQIPSYRESEFVPKSYIRFVADLEDAAERAFKNRAKISTEHSRALGSVRGKLRKVNLPFKGPISNYRKDPDGYVDHDEESSDEEVDETTTGQKSWFDKTEADQLTQVQDKAKEGWSDVAKKDSKPKKNAWMKSEEEGDKKDQRQEAKPSRPKAVKKPTGPKVAKVERVVTEDNLEVRLEEMKSERGYRGTNPADQLLELEKYLKVAETPRKLVLVLEMIISTLFDVNPTHSEFMPVDIWRTAISNFARVLYLIQNDKSLQFPNLVILYERLDDEFIKSLQYIDPHTQDYVNRLKDEMLILDIGERVFEVCEANRTQQATVAVRLIEHLYYRKQDDHERLFKNQREIVPQILSDMSKTWISKKEVTEPATFYKPSLITEDVHTVLVKLSNLVFAENAANGNHIQQLQNMKCVVSLIYHLALRGEWERARDLLLRTRVGDSINQLVDRDVSIMIGYNRAICQLGICAFRNGLISEAHYLLSEICSSGKVKELLAQGLTSSRDKTKKVEHEKAERSRLVLYHKHINPDMLEGVHLITAMLLEVPNMAQRSFTKRKVISKSFRRLLDFYDRQVFSGPPENTRDHINAAAKFLIVGDWQQCYNNLVALDDMWSLMIDADNVKHMLLEKAKVEAMRTYLFSYGHHYDTISVTNLSSMFALEERLVHGVVSKMMTNEELYAAWDQPTNSFKLYRSEPTKLQQLALQLSETAGAFVEWNEKMYEAKSQGGSMIVMGKDFDQKKKKQPARPSTSTTSKPTGPKSQSGDRPKRTPSDRQSSGDRQKRAPAKTY